MAYSNLISLMKLIKTTMMLILIKHEAKVKEQVQKTFVSLDLEYAGVHDYCLVPT